ncbi:DNA-binding response regulator [Noviherbaspirillum saxi]|uniref:DNA-binding response regulator n=2 Tax=Noviherbaspirillum saxi TaxID=2320863 RepID=A0A3A3FX87_9BURK|nr:DNA-binding response regulator [Noviherbaspirillum saxi]
MPRLFIVDDEAPARVRLKTLLSDIAATCPHQLVGEAEHPQGALDGIAATSPDIVLLDVQMPGMTGLELAKHLARLPLPPAVIFVTAYDEFALKAFEVHALDYLLKPVRAARLADALQRVGELRGKGGAPTPVPHSVRQHFSVQERGRLLLVPIAEVLYLKAEQKYVTLRTRSQEYLFEESLTSIEDELGATFVRVHRNALVARQAIVGVERGSASIDIESEHDKAQESWQVILRGIEERLPISRRQWPVVKALVK